MEIRATDSETSGAGSGRSRGASDVVTVMTTCSVLTNSTSITSAYRQMRGMSRPVSRLLYTLERTFYLLDHLHHTTTGYDELPAWFLRLTAPVYAGIIARLINLSVAHTHIPTQWKTSIILPIPKIQQPVTPIDYRPISITPVLSRLLERFIVHTFIYPTFDTPPLNHQLSDQFAFRPTGSTTAALISIIQQSTSLLKHEPYVSLFSFDFSKAFDTVRHSALAGKLSRIDIPDEVYNSIICFLNGRSHVTRYAGLVSGIAYIIASVVQGSGFGPSSFDIVASDLHHLHQQNSLAKYGDDTYFIVPASARTTVRDELDHISVWLRPTT